MWNKDGARDPREFRCDQPGTDEVRGLIYCDKHKHLHRGH
jgi:hypothetical protein